MIIDFHPDARAETLKAKAWFSEQGEELGQAFAMEISHAIDQIANNPRAWPRYSGSIRRYLLQRFPYSMTSSVKGL